MCDKLPYPSFLAAVVVRLRRHDYQLFLNLATLMIAEQLSQATMWRHGLKRTEASISEHTRHSSI